MFLCSFKALNRGLYENLAHDARLCLMWALMSCKDHTQGLYPTTQMVRAEWGPRGSLMTTPIERATLEWRTYKLELCFLTWIYIYPFAFRIPVYPPPPHWKCLGFASFDGWGPPTQTHQPTKVWLDTSIRVPSSQHSSMTVKVSFCS